MQKQICFGGEGYPRRYFGQMPAGYVGVRVSFTAFGRYSISALDPSVMSPCSLLIAVDGTLQGDRHRLIPCLSTTQPIKTSVWDKRSLLAVVFECIDHQIDGNHNSGQDAD